jgi:hypothetical protein
MEFVESRAVLIELSVLTVVESVVELEDPDPHAARIPTNVTVNSFFILKWFDVINEVFYAFIPLYQTGNPIKLLRFFYIQYPWLDSYKARRKFLSCQQGF